MNKKSKLKYYKRVRKIRDELLKCDNEGRQRRLVMELPNTSSIHISTGWTLRCEVELNNGYTIYYDGHNNIINCGIDAYMYWLKNNCK